MDADYVTSGADNEDVEDILENLEEFDEVERMGKGRQPSPI